MPQGEGLRESQLWGRGGTHKAALYGPARRHYKWLLNANSVGAGTRGTEIFFRGKKESVRDLTLSCCHQLLGPAHYNFRQASKGLIFHSGMSRWKLGSSASPKGYESPPLGDRGRQGSASKRKTFAFQSTRPTPSVLYAGPRPQEELRAGPKMNETGSKVVVVIVIVIIIIIIIIIIDGQEETSGGDGYIMALKMTMVSQV